jgi:hypothetical protein
MSTWASAFSVDYNTVLCTANAVYNMDEKL